MTVKLWFLLVVVGILLMVIHDEMTGGMQILSDIVYDPNVSKGWPWNIGAAGVVSFFLGGVIFFVERMQRSKNDARTAKIEERRRRAIDQLSS